MADEWRRIDIRLKNGVPSAREYVLCEDDSAIRQWRVIWAEPNGSWCIRLDGSRLFMMTSRDHIIVCIKP